jgi:hypothetical protein
VARRVDAGGCIKTIHLSVRRSLTKTSPDTRMALHSSHITPSFESSTTIHQRLEHATSVSDSACKPVLNPLGLGERIRNGLRSVMKPPPEVSLSSESAESSEESLLLLDVDRDDQQAFSPISASNGMGARLSLTRTPHDGLPSTVVWTSASRQPPAWGQWPSHNFSHCISVLTESDARVAYTFDAETLPPVYECVIDCVVHLWLVVPSRPSADGRMQLTEGQMRAAVEFYEGVAAATTTAMISEKEAADGDGGGEGSDVGYCAEACEGAVLLSCAEGNEVDAIALAVLLLAHQSCEYGHGRSMRDEFGGPNGPTYDASRVIDDDPGVSYAWKGLLGWQDVERVQAALW